VVEAGAVLATDVEQVRESAGGDQGGPGAALLEQRVGADGHAVGERLDFRRLGARAEYDLLDRRHHAARLIVRGGGDLGRVQTLAVEQRGIGEGPADVDAQLHRANLPARVRDARPEQEASHT
jgi:hypothetical protein